MYIMRDILGQAIMDYYKGIKGHKLWVHDTLGPPVAMKTATYFREEAHMPEWETMALQLCRGAVLDIGAGAGSHTLCLQKKGFDVTAMDISAGACAVMQQRGVRKVLLQDIYAFSASHFDTLLLLMNGIGLTGSLEGLKRFLQHATLLLKPGGQLLFDSSDVAYLYEDGLSFPPHYYGAIKCCYEYKNEKTDWFTWLYIDKLTLMEVAQSSGWRVEIVLEDPSDQYLARLTLL